MQHKIKARVIMFDIDPIKFVHELVEIYSNAEKKEKLTSLIREMLLREIVSNLDLLSEVKNLCKRKNDPLNIEERIRLLQHLQFDFFEFSRNTGIPLSDVIKGDFKVNTASKYASKMKKYTSNAQLVEKTYSRMRMQFILAKENITKRSDSIGYTIELCLNAKLQIEEQLKH